MKKTVLIFFILIMFSCQVLAGNVTKSNRLFDWAEQSFPQYFSPAGSETFWAEDFLVRYYEHTDTYIATLGEYVFLYGNIFGGLAYEGQIDEYDDYLPPPMLQMSLSDIQPYLPAIKLVGSLGYAIYQNDGDISTGLIMRTLNPMGEVLKNQDYMINLLETMVGTLQDIENQLAAMDQKLNTVLLEIKLSKSEILGNINDPHEYISNIDSYEKELRQLADRNAPRSADQNQLDELADNILDYGPDGVFNQVNQIHNAITASQSGREPVLKNFTDQLILKTAESTDINKYENAYQALENYTMKLISGEARGANLLVDAHLYRDEKEAASQINDMLQENIQEIMSLSDISEGTMAQYGFIYNTARLMLSSADPYYDAPGRSGEFIPAAAGDIFKRAEFLKRRLLNDDEPVVVVYSITEVGEDVADLYLTGTSPIRSTRSPESITSHLIQGKGYDNWDGRTMRFNNQYQLNIYTFHLDARDSGDWYVHGDNVNSIGIKVQNYRQDMVVDPDGGIVFGFGLITKRNSHRFDALQWHECGDFVDTNHFDDSLISYDGTDDEYLNNPLGHQVWLKTTCDERNDDGDCINNTSDWPTGDISLCTYFTYGGTSERHVTMDTKLYRRLIMDAENDHGTDGDVWGRIKLYVRDEDAGINYFLYENEHQHIQGWQYNYQHSDYFTEDLKLVPGHRYHMRIHLHGHIEQGLMSRNGYVELKIHTAEPIRFIFDE